MRGEITSASLLMFGNRKFKQLAILFSLSAALRPAGGRAQGSEYLDLSPFGRMQTWDGAQAREVTIPGSNLSNIGIEWDEERDVRELAVAYAGTVPESVRIEYWFRNWPYAPPKMPTIEDPVDDPWQGEWLAARTSPQCNGSNCKYTFEPLEGAENKLAGNLPGVRYRRTLKVRLVFPTPTTTSALRVFSDSKRVPVSVRLELGQQGGTATWSGGVSVFNGHLRSAKPWHFAAGDEFHDAAQWRFQAARPKGILIDLDASQAAPAGSHDVTIVTVKAEETTAGRSTPRNFSFSVDDLKRGTVEIPDFHVRVALVNGSKTAGKAGRRIRSRIPQEPEQSYERATREIPPLDPWHRENGGRVYLPLAADSSWQKFALEYGGNVFISKGGTKAKGEELARLQWEGDRVQWKIGTGEKPYYRDDEKVSVSVLDGYLPVGIQKWENDGLRYTEEAFATLLNAPLSPEDPSRSEKAPAILMMRLTAENSGQAARTAHLWLGLEPHESLGVNGRLVEVSGKLRAIIHTPSGEAIATAADGNVHASYQVPARESRSVVIKLPFVSDVKGDDSSATEALKYEDERARVVKYWQQIVAATTRFTVPEPKFNELARSVIPHIRISTTKDPRSGLYMVPAGSYNYQVFANETCFQVLLLDTLGDFKTAAAYLETLLKLQGTRNFPGLHKGPPDGIFHGARVDATYDYTASNYGLDHGTVVWTLAEHYLYTRDRDWFAHAWPHLKKGIDWIVEQRSATMLKDAGGNRVREYGLLPASHLEDNSDWAHWFAINAYSWAGLDRSAAALEDLKHPEAPRVRREADAYRTDLRAAVLRASESSPVVRMQDGTYEPFVPVQPLRRLRLFGPLRMAYYTRYARPEAQPLLRLSADREGLYGPMILLILGVFEPDEPAAQWILDDWEDNLTLTSGMGMNIHGMTDDRYWFSQGGMVFQANLQNPVQVYLKRHEVPAAIRNLYNNFVSCLYPQVNAFTEEYHQWRAGSGPFYKIPDEARFVNRVRDLLVLEDGNSLWLASGAPRHWLESRDGIRVDQAMTYFGPVSYTMHPGTEAGTIQATVQLPARNPAKDNWLVARVPHGHIQSVTIDGRSWTDIDQEREAIRLPKSDKNLEILIHFR